METSTQTQTTAHTEAPRELHRSYLKHSPFYAALYARYGSSMSPATAHLIAKDHGTTLAELTADGDVVERGDLIRTLDLVLTLGY